MNCKLCHHLPSGRFDAAGMQCYCQCHDIADLAPELFFALRDVMGGQLGNGADLDARRFCYAREVVAKAEEAARAKAEGQSP